MDLNMLLCDEMEEIIPAAAVYLSSPMRSATASLQKLSMGCTSDTSDRYSSSA